MVGFFFGEAGHYQQTSDALHSPFLFSFGSWTHLVQAAATNEETEQAEQHFLNYIILYAGDNPAEPLNTTDKAESALNYAVELTGESPEELNEIA
jgi:hypothetical protein